MHLLDRIAMDPAVRFGKPCVKGTRISVGDVLEYLAGGMSEDAILADFPSSRGTTSGRASPTRPSVSGGH